jgi:HlyD family secretion protein
MPRPLHRYLHQQSFGFVSVLGAASVALVAASLTLPSHTFAAERVGSGSKSGISVSVATAQRRCFSDTLQVTGTLVPKKENLVGPNHEGLQISEVLVDAGDNVTSGQVLARLAPPEGQPGKRVAVQAPAAGVVTSKTAQIGMIASSRAPPLFHIAEGGEMELLAEAPAKTLGSIHPNQQARIEIIGVGDLAGKVRLVSTEINPTTQLGQVRLLIGNDSRLRAGAFGRAKIELGQRCAPAVPLSALLYGIDGAVIQVVRDGRVETRHVTFGLIAGGQVEIREGVTTGEVVVSRAGTFVREGDLVHGVSDDTSAQRK